SPAAAATVGRRRARLDHAGYARAGAGAAARAGHAAEARDAEADDDKPTPRRADHPLRQAWSDSRQGIWSRRRRHLRADTLRSAELHRRIPVGRSRRHTLVDLPRRQYGRRADGAARTWLLESVLFRIQAARL